MFLLRLASFPTCLALLGRRIWRYRAWGMLRRCGVVDVVFEAGGGSHGDDSRAELDADGYVVVGDEAAFAESDG